MNILLMRKEERPAPSTLSGSDVLNLVSNVENDFGKGKQNKKGKDSEGPWKNRSIFFELPYWQHNKCWHNLDVMHIEKNICDNKVVLGGFSNVASKLIIISMKMIVKGGSIVLVGYLILTSSYCCNIGIHLLLTLFSYIILFTYFLSILYDIFA